MNDLFGYTEAERTAITAELSKRRWICYAPAALLLLAAIMTFVGFRLHRDVSGWVWSGLLTVLSGSYLLFFQEVYVRPAKLMQRHIRYMLDGPFRTAEGTVSALELEPKDKDGLDCYRLSLNVGQAGDPNDERLFYVDSLKGAPAIAVGMRVRVHSNDRMVARLEGVPKEH